MFALSEDDLPRSILGCADGPAAFNAVLTQQGGKVVSCDPLYAHATEEIEARIHECYETVLEQTRRNADGFLWTAEIPDVDALGRIRMESMQRFLDDFSTERNGQRYVGAELPSLPFGDGQFDLALCSHFLFLYGELGTDFHVKSVLELTRVAAEVRIFPLIQLDRRRSPHLPAILDAINASELATTLVPVAYEFQRGANEMLRIARTS